MFSSYTGVIALYERVYSCFKHNIYVGILGLRTNFHVLHPSNNLCWRGYFKRFEHFVCRDLGRVAFGPILFCLFYKFW